MANRPVKEQPEFWVGISNFELPFVLFLQKVAMVSRFSKFHLQFQDLLSSCLLSYFPLFLYSFGRTDLCLKLTHGLMFYALLSSVAKFTIPRMRPAHYPGVFGEGCVQSSSFPSRHSIAVAVFSSIIPWPIFKYIFIFSMALNRVITGAHFPSDTLAGILIGFLCNWLAEQITNPIILTFVGLVALYLWPSAARAVGSPIALLYLPDSYHCHPPTLIITIAIYYIHNNYIRGYFYRRKAGQYLCFVVEVTCTVLYTALLALINIVGNKYIITSTTEQIQ